MRCPRGKEGEVIFPDTLREISPNGFELCKSFTSIKYANCPYYNYLIFKTCNKLQFVETGSNNEGLKAVDEVLYSKDMTDLYFCSKLKEGDYVIPDTVTKIHAGAFIDSQLTSITIPKSVIDIDHYSMNAIRQSFHGTINYLGTIEEWEKITFSDSVQDSWHIANRMTVHCLDGDAIFYAFDD